MFNCKILYATDLHVDKAFLDEILDIAISVNPDIIILGGDLVPKSVYSKIFSHFGDLNGALLAQKEYLIDDFVPTIVSFREKSKTPIFVDFGNDDFWDNRDVLVKAEEKGLINLLHLKETKVLENLSVVGYMNVPLTPFSIKDGERFDSVIEPCVGFNFRTEGIFSQQGKIIHGKVKRAVDNNIASELEALGNIITAKKCIFVTHAPPYATKLDMMYPNIHIGSKSLRAFIEKNAHRFVVSLHGHIHESPNVSGDIGDEIFGVRCFNPGQLGRHGLQYCIVNI